MTRFLKVSFVVACIFCSCAVAKQPVSSDASYANQAEQAAMKAEEAQLRAEQAADRAEKAARDAAGAQAACCEKTAAAEPAPQQKESLRIHMRGDSQLNYYQGSSHTLFICIHQLKDRNPFNQLAGGENGVLKLLECGSFDPSVANFAGKFIQPGQETTYVLDRADGARFIGITAGYFNTTRKEKVVRVFSLPADENKGLLIDLYFGPEGMSVQGNK